MANVTEYRNIDVNDDVFLLSTNDTPQIVELKSKEIDDVSIVNSEFNIKSLFAEGPTPNYYWYFSSSGNFGRATWISAQYDWGDSAGTVGQYDRFHLITSTSANQVMATPNGSTGKGDMRAVVANDLPVVPIGKGGTGQTSLYNATHYFGMGKTAGDTITNSGYTAVGYLTDAKRQVTITMCFPWIFYDSPTATVSGTVTIRQNGIYLFGSSSGKSLSSLTVTTSVAWDGRMLINIRGTADSSAKNNDVVAVYFNSLTITLS